MPLRVQKRVRGAKNGFIQPPAHRHVAANGIEYPKSCSSNLAIVENFFEGEWELFVSLQNHS